MCTFILLYSSLCRGNCQSYGVKLWRSPWSFSEMGKENRYNFVHNFGRSNYSGNVMSGHTLKWGGQKENAEWEIHYPDRIENNAYHRQFLVIWNHLCSSGCNSDDWTHSKTNCIHEVTRIQQIKDLSKKHIHHNLEVECGGIQFVILSTKRNLDICYQTVWAS